MNKLAPVSLLLVLAACDRPAAPTPAPSAAPGPSTRVALAPAAPSAAPPQAAAPDLDVESQKKQLGCAGGKPKEACRILDEFKEAGPWSGQTPSGEGRWFGRTYLVERGKEQTDTLILLARRVPTAELGPSDLPVRVATGTLPPDQRKKGAKLVSVLSRSNNVSQYDQAAKYVRSFTSADARGAVRAASGSVRLIANEATFLREGAGRKLLMVQPSAGASAAPGDGTYAELWLTTW